MDKYTAIWVSHSSISDFQKCPRAYFLKNIYKERNSGRKISLITPALALGQVVHEVLEGLSTVKAEKRFTTPLLEIFDRKWQKVTGKKGGFISDSQEKKYKQRGEEMIRTITKEPRVLSNLAIKIKTDLPYYWLSEEDELILCGKIDWMEYLPETDSVHIVDFKTGRAMEDKNSLQLPVYYLLAHNCQKRKVDKASYWYLSLNGQMVSQKLPDLESAKKQILAIAKKMKLARQLEKFKCSSDEGCRYCKEYEQILNGEAELVGINDFNQSVYALKKPLFEDMADSEIL